MQAVSSGTILSTNMLPDSTGVSETGTGSSDAVDSDVRLQTVNPTIGRVEFVQELIKCHKLTLQAITDDPMFSLPSAQHCALFVNYARELIICSDNISSAKEVVDALSDVFVDRHIVSQTDRDAVMLDIHHVWHSATVENSFVDYVRLSLPTADDVTSRRLFQVWLRKFVQQMISVLCNMCTQFVSTQVDDKLSDIDQNILYHVSGYIIIKTQNSRV